VVRGGGGVEDCGCGGHVILDLIGRTLGEQTDSPASEYAPQES